MIKIKNLSFKYDSSNDFALREINLTIDKGDFVGIIGGSGAGKSSLTYAINGIIPHYHKGDFYGEVIVDGKDTVENLPEILSLTVGSVLQDIDSQMLSSTVEDEVIFGLENYGVSLNEIEERIKTALDCVGIGNLRDREIRSLSGGQKQKLVIAAIIALKPQIILLDKPTGELDPQSSRQVFEVLKTLNENYGITVIIVEQKIMQLCEYCKKLILMDKGKVIIYDEISKVLSDTTMLKDLGVNVPRIVSLWEILKNNGYYNGKIPTNLWEAEAMVRRLIDDRA